MTTQAPVALVSRDARLAADIRRLCAAAGLSLEVVGDAGGVMRSWRRATAVLVDAELADAVVPTVAGARRGGVVLITSDVDRLEVWRAATALGAEQVLSLPEDDRLLVERLAVAAAPAAPSAPVLGILPGVGGAGASMLAVIAAVAAARAAGTATLVDADRFGGGIDLLLGAEQLPGTRWPDLVGARRSVDVAALAESLPTVHGLRVLAVGRHDTRLEVDAMAPVLTAVRMLPGPVVVDLPSRLDAAAEIAVTACTSLVVVVRAEVRAAAAAAVLAEVARQLTHDVCLVVRRAPHSQLRAADVAAAVGLPLVATYESDPALAAAADDGRLTQLRRPGAIAAVADEILDRLAAAAASP